MRPTNIFIGIEIADITMMKHTSFK